MRTEVIGDGPRWTCEECGDHFDREKAGKRQIRFCTQSCYHSFARREKTYLGTFSKGAKPWNKGVKGLQLSPHSQWKKGQRSINWQPVGSQTVRVDKNGKSRAYVKVANPNVWKERAIVVYEMKNGSVPDGHVVHHKDRNPLNDSPANLQALTRADHINEHRQEMRAA
jgi:hypothetical protein